MIGHSFPTLEENPYIPTMHKNPFIYAIGVAVLLPLWAWAQSSAPGPSSSPAMAKAPADGPIEPPTEAEKLLDAAIKKVAALTSVSADMVQSIDLLSQKFQLSGRYLKAPGNRVYLKLVVNGLPSSTGTTLQVCDGTTLWDYQQVLETTIYRKLNVVKVFQMLAAPEIDAKLREQVKVQIGFAGPETLLSGLRKSVKFDQKETGKLGDKAVLILRGTWIDKTGLITPNGQPVPKEAPLPPYVPSVVSLWIGEDDGWPYKIVFQGKAPSILEDNRPRGPDGQPIGSKVTNQKVPTSRVEIVYSNVNLKASLNLATFVFQAPPGAAIEDSTEGLVTMLQQHIKVEASKQKSSESTETLLDKSLELPKAPAPPEK
jgi:outer membrane lipoprotein-sorting protein